MVMSASCSHNSKETRRMQTVKIDTVFSVEGQTPLQFPGKVKAAQDVNLSFRVSGTIGKICVEDGARVRKGQLLAQLDPTRNSAAKTFRTLSHSLPLPSRRMV